MGNLLINYDGDIWELLGQGTVNDGKIYCHLASTTRGRQQKNGFVPIQMADWIPQTLIKKEASLNSPHVCVPWRGAGGEIGKCIWCGYDLRAAKGG